MADSSKANPASIESPDDSTSMDQGKLPYEPPRITKKRSVARVTLFSGGGVATVGLVTSG